jgi:hypothetical protein
MDLKNLIETHLDLPRLSKDLSEIGHWARVWSVRQWTRANMRTLWEASRGFLPIDLNDFVPGTVPPLVEVIHQGQNSLPVHTHFEKRFCRPSDPAGEGTLLGYNHQALSAVTGPGYFVVRPSGEAGEVAIDYTAVPKEKPRDWPPILPNQVRLGRFVYDGMVDVMRGLASHVSIGRAKKQDRWMDNWFVLVRDDTPSNGVERQPPDPARIG